jgi:hypothetical protein
LAYKKLWRELRRKLGIKSRKLDPTKNIYLLATRKGCFFVGARPGAFAGRAPNFLLYHTPHILSSGFFKKNAQRFIPKFI